MSANPFAHAAFGYRAHGWTGTIPLPYREKSAPPVGYIGAKAGDRYPSGADVQAWIEEYEGQPRNICLRLPAGVVGIDVDHYEKAGVTKLGGESLDQLVAALGPLPATWTSTNRTDGVSGIRLYQAPAGLRWPGKTGSAGGIDIIHAGNRYIVAAPSLHDGPDHRPYRWLDPAGEVVDFPADPSELPHLPEAWVEYLTRYEAATDRVSTGASMKAFRAQLRHGDACPYVDRLLDEGAQAVNGPNRHDDVNTVVMQLHRAAVQGHRGVGDALDTLEGLFKSALSGDRRGAEHSEWLRSVAGAVDQIGLPQPGVTCRCRPAYVAPPPPPMPGKQPGPPPFPSPEAPAIPAQEGQVVTASPVENVIPMPRAEPPLQPPPAATVVEPHRGQLRMAERLVGMWNHQLRHAHGVGWHVWDGARWAEDEDGAPTRYVVDMLKRSYGDLQHLDVDDRKNLLADIAKCESANGVAGVTRLAGDLYPVAVTHKVLDQDPYLFNTPAGTCDLASGVLRQHERTDHLTKMAAAGPGERSAVWEAFLEQVLPDAEVRSFVQRLMGAALLGEVREQYMPILTGTGANGKGVFRDALLHALGDYATEVDPALLMESKHERHGTFKMELRGRRVVFCSETERGKAFAESTMKRLTGGDPIQANRMHRDPITFDPSHTLVMVTNHLPRISGDDPAVARRMLVVPFTVVIPKELRDTQLPQRLKAEAAGVIRWCLDGWTAYQEQGLNPPEAVQLATDEYLSDSDLMGEFIDDRCLRSPLVKTKAPVLYDAYRTWCGRSGENALPQKEFAHSMENRGFKRKREASGWWYLGLEPHPEDD